MLCLTCFQHNICIQENDVKLILTDYCMPGMTGYDLLMEVKVDSFLKEK